MIRRIANRMQGETLAARAIRGTAFTVLLFGSQNLLRLVSNLILTRLLFPEAFGLMALVQVVINGINLFSDIGMGSAVVRSPRGDDADFLDTAWTLKVARGIGLYAVLLLLAPVMARFYDAPELTGLLAVSGLQLALNGFSSIAMISASRHLRLGRISLMQIGAQIVGIAAMVGLALVLESVWALAIGGLVQSVTSTVLSHVVIDSPRRRFRVERAALSEIFHFGKYIFIGTIAAFLIQNGDRAVLGKFVSLEELAVFAIALTLARVVTDLSDRLTSRVLFPLYAQRPPGRNPEHRRRINRARRLMNLAFISATGGLACIGDGLIRLLYDSRYEAAGPLLVLLALASIPRLIIMSYPRLTDAAGHSGRLAGFQTSVAVAQTLILILSVQIWGVAGAALAPALATLLSYPVLVVLVRPFGGVDFRHDAMMAALGLAFAALAGWLHWPQLAALFAG